MRAMKVFHPESPGEYIPVVRNWFQRLLYPKYFATSREISFYYKFREAMDINVWIHENKFVARNVGGESVNTYESKWREL